MSQDTSFHNFKSIPRIYFPSIYKFHRILCHVHINQFQIMKIKITLRKSILSNLQGHYAYIAEKSVSNARAITVKHSQHSDRVQKNGTE